MKREAAFWIVVAVLAAGCQGSTGPTLPEVEPLPQVENGNFVLYVSNQSFALPRVDITIHIDDKEAVSSDFDVGNQHNWVQHTFQLDPGKHKLVAASREGSALLEQGFEVKDKHWAVVDYWYSKQDGKKQFSFVIQDQPIGFM